MIMHGVGCRSINTGCDGDCDCGAVPSSVEDVLPALLRQAETRNNSGPPVAIRTLHAEHDINVTLLPCLDNTPGWFHLHWREWHRGHGCDRDDGQPRSAEAQALIEHLAPHRRDR